jgi:benzoyl-CoA reductase/2-hydroxyglutaryl-CoA dehydratase subunit BcrC/BadD/HgdB
MNVIAYHSPFVPPEWIEARALRPLWLRPRGLATSGARAASASAVRRGVCPFAGSVIDALTGAVGDGVAAAVLASGCDQMRYAAALIEQQGDLPLFLMHVPSTWQTSAARALYLEELRRLGRFLVRHGGVAPSSDVLAAVMARYDDARSALRASRDRLAPRQYAEAVAALRSGEVHSDAAAGTSGATAGLPGSEPPPAAPNGSVPLALLGGPLLEPDYAVFDLIARAGGRVVLDGTEDGQRTLPRPFDPARLHNEPLQELADAYFGSIPDVFRRPNDLLYDWLAAELDAAAPRGIILRRFVWCDLWHAEVARLRERSPVPVLEIDVNHDEPGASARLVGRLEAFLETLR